MKQRAYLYLLATFVIGMAIGAVGMFIYTWYGGHWRPKRLDFAQYLSQQLQLDQNQNNQINQILDQSHKKADALRAQLRPQFDPIRQQTNEEILKVLTPDQAKKFPDVERIWRESTIRR